MHLQHNAPCLVPSGCLCVMVSSPEHICNANEAGKCDRKKQEKLDV